MAAPDLYDQLRRNGKTHYGFRILAGDEVLDPDVR
jgi:hypothetical protein